MTELDTRSRLPITLNGEHYDIDLAAYRRQAVAATRQLYDQGGEVSEQTLNTQYIWKRSAEDWRLGAGQAYFDTVQDSDRRRFHDSIGIDPWTTRGLTLLPEVSLRYTEAAFINPGETWLIVAGGQLIYARNLCNDSAGTWTDYSIDFVNDAEADTWTYTNIVTGAGSIESLCADGNSFYYKLVGTNQLKRRIVTGTLTSTSSNIGDNTKVVTNLRIVAGRLLGQTFGATDFLYEVKASSVTTIASYETGQMPIITGACAGPDGIYLAGITARSTSGSDWSGVHCTIFRSGIDSTSGAVQAPAPVSALPDGEAVTAVLAYSGYMVLGTSQGVRLARWTATGGVEYGPVISISSANNAMTNTTASAKVVGVYSMGVQALEGEGPFVWFGWSDKVFVDCDGNTRTYAGMGRVDLSRFVNDLQPAYASDMMVEIQDRPVQSIASFQGKRYFTLQLYGPYGQTANKVEMGELSTGQITYGTPELKRATSLELRTSPLPHGATVRVCGMDEFDTLIVTDSMVGDNAYDYQLAMTDIAGESASLHFQLYRAITTTEAPTLRRWTLRALAVPYRQEEIWLPIILHDEVTHAGEVPVAFDIKREFSIFRALMQARSVITLVMGNEAIDVFIDAVETGGDQIAKLTRWNSEESWPEGVWFVKCITI